MRFFPVVSAILVCVALFFVVLRRDDLFERAALLTGDAPTEAADSAPPTAPAAPVAIDAGGAAEAPPVHVAAIRSVAREVADAVMVRGQSEAAREVSLAAEVTGTVVSEPIRKGAFVAAGEVLCELDPGSSGASLAEAEARLAEARARVPEAEARVPQAQAVVVEVEARLEEARINQNAAARLSDSGFATTTRVATADAALRSAEAGVIAAQTGLESVSAGIESARAGVQAAEAAMERARLDIEKLTIEAPFAGLLETDTAELGTLLQGGGGGEGCATVVQLDPIKLVGFLPEAQVDRVAVGMSAGARLASGQEATGTVTFLSRSADDLTRTFRVEVTAPNPNLEIRDGQTVEILIATPAATAHLVPASALTLDGEGRLGLRTVEDGRAGFAPVELLRDTVDGVYVSGLPDVAEIITVGQEYVTDGVPVRATFDAMDAEVSQ